MKITKIYLTILIMILTLILGCVGSDSVSNTIDNIIDNTTIENTIENVSLTSEITDELQANTNNMYVKYSTHIQDVGWENDFSKVNGQTSGTTGKSLRIEAIKIDLVNATENVGITYQVFVQGKNWQDWVQDGEVAGTTGECLRIEGIKIKLTGTDKYSVEYRVHVQDVGWMNWQKDGEVAGYLNKELKIEAIEVKIISKTISVMYQTNTESKGWGQYVNDGDTSETVGLDLKVRAIKIELINTNIKVRYQTHIQDVGWQEWKENGQESGISTQNKRVEAIRIKLEDELDDYSIMYRVYVQNNGWQEWKKDGEDSGTTGKSLRVEAIEIKIVEKNISGEFSVRYQSHIQDVGWQKYVNQGNLSGIEGSGLKVEAIRIVSKNIPENVKIKYQSHVQDIGWQEWVNDGEISGTTGKNLKIEAVKIKVEGTDKYSITYRTYIQGRGWQDWANDGEISGTTGKNLRIEAIEVKIVPKIENNIKTQLDTTIGTTVYPTKNFKMSGWLMTDIKNIQIQILVNNEIIESQIIRTERQDVLDTIKGYGGQDKNSKPGFEITADFSELSEGNLNIKIQFINEKGEILSQIERNTNLLRTIKYAEGIYGQSGLKIAGKGGSDLKYLKYGSGENVFFATFAIHGYEDLWSKDGEELVTIANNFYNKLLEDQDYDLAQKWTIYIFPGVNQDGLKSGWTNNGPGRTTLYSLAPQNKGIDLNRCWQIGESYTRYEDNRNYNGTTGFQAYEAQALRDFFIKNKSRTGQTLLVDFHGFTQQLIGDPDICSYYEKQFPENDKSSVGRYGNQYMINWARTYLASNLKPAKTALIELPHQGVTGHQSFIDKNFSNRYINATLSMLKGI